MATALQKFRAQYPQYNDLDDETLGQRIHQTFYSDIPEADFRRRAGLPAAPQAAQEPEFDEILDQSIQERRSSQNPLTGDPDALAGFELEPPEAVGVSSEDVEAAKQRGFINNATRLAAERGTGLLGNAIRGIIGKPGQALEERFGGGQIVFGTDWGPDDPADGKFRVRYMDSDEWDEFQQGNQVDNVFTDSVPDYLLSREFGGVPRATVDSIKESYENGEIGGTLGNVFAFGLEQGIQSVPDMLAVMAGPLSLAGYIGARADEIGETRAENKGLEEGTFQENLEAMPFAIGSALFEKFGAGKIKAAWGGKAADEIGQEVLEAGLNAAAKRVAKRTGTAAASEAGTEAFQEGVLEYLGEKLGTDAPLTWEEAVERGFFGGLGGFTPGAVFGGAAAVGGETTRALDDRFVFGDADQDTIEVEDAPDTDFDDDGNVVPTTPEPEVDPAVRQGELEQLIADGESMLESAIGRRDAEQDIETQDALANDARAIEANINAWRQELADITGEVPPGFRRPDGTMVPQDGFPERPRAKRDDEPDEPQYFDNRLKREEYRVGLANMAGELQVGGGGMGTLIYEPEYDGDPNPPVVGRVPSENPGWFQDLAGTDAEMSVNQVQTAVEKALNGQKLGVRQSRVVNTMLDSITDGRVSGVESARAQLEAARESRRQARRDSDLLPDEYDEIAGERFEETDYLPEMDAEARILDELAAELDMYGEEISERVGIILDGAESTYAAMQALEALLDEQRTTKTGTQVTASEEGSGQAAEMEGRQETGETVAEPEQEVTEADALPISRDRRGVSRGTDRRQDTRRRDEVSRMTVDEVIDKLYTDELTGLMNRRAFNEELDDASAVGSIDVDGLSGVNDNLGHNAGDALIRAVGKALKDASAKYGTDAFHISGDEFYVLGDDGGQVQATINDAKRELEAQVLEADKGQLTGIQITTGIAGNKANADEQMERTKKPARRKASATRKACCHLVGSCTRRAWAIATCSQATTT